MRFRLGKKIFRGRWSAVRVNRTQQGSSGNLLYSSVLLEMNSWSFHLGASISCKARAGYLKMGLTILSYSHVELYL
jgi:hypothetical protein